MKNVSESIAAPRGTTDPADGAGVDGQGMKRVQLDADEGTQSIDGRQRRRLRNIESVRNAILSLMLERERIDLDAVAARAGVTVRSIYRYHADLEAAVEDACEHRTSEILALWDRWQAPDPSEPLDDRIDAMLAHRIEMELLGRPLRNRIMVDSPDPRFDREVLEVFEPELARLGEADRWPTTAALCFMLRPRGLRSILEFPQHDDVDAQTMVAYSIRRLLSASSSDDATASSD